MVRKYINHGKTSKTPRRPFEAERLDKELKMCGEYGLRCKREIWRVNKVLNGMRFASRELLTLEDDHPRRQVEGAALLRRCSRLGLLDDTKMKLDYVLALTVTDLLDRRLETVVFKNGMAKSIHHARVLIKHGHIRVGKQKVDVPSFMVRLDSEKHIGFSPKSPFGGGKPGRVKARKIKNQSNKKGGDEDEDEEED